MRRRLRPFFAALVLTACSGDAFIASRSDVDDANALLAEGRYEEALTAYDALESKNPRIAFNRALALMGLEKWDEAIAAFDEAREASDVAMKAQSYFHVGTVHARRALVVEKTASAPVLQAPVAPDPDPNAPAPEPEAPVDPSEAALPHWQAAVDALENALTLQPDYPEAKHQLEVALMRVDPPCHLRNDKQEPNNAFGGAFGITLADPPEDAKDAAPGEKRAKLDLVVCPDDTDWLKVAVEKGDRVTAKVTKSKGADHALPNVSAWAADGKTRLSQPPKTDPGGTLVAIPSVSLTGSADSGELHLLVDEPGGDEFAGSVEITVRPACERTEGPEEPNDERAAAKLIEAVKADPKEGAAPPGGPGDPPAPGAGGGAPEGPQPTVGRLCPGNEDYFVVNVGPGESLELTAQLMVQAGTVKLTLEDDAGNVLAEGKKGEKDTLVALAYNPGAKPVYVHLQGADAEAVYGLTAKLIPPCVQREDDNEENDSSAAARALGPGKYEKQQLCPGDPDVFSVNVKPGESVIAHLKAEPIHGVPTLAVTDGQTQVFGSGFALKGGQLAMALDPGEGTYYVEVAGDSDARYTLEIQVLPACPEGNDAEEQNDEPDKAKALALPPPPEQQPGAPPGAAGQAEQEVTRLLRICPGDVDFFRIGVTPESQLLVASIEFVHEKGDLELAELEADGETIVQEAAPSAATTNLESVIVPPPDVRIPDPTDYLLRIQGATPEVENFYVLTLRPLPPSGKDGNEGESGDQNQEPQDPSEPQEPQDPGEEPKEPEEQKPDRETIEKAMEADDEQSENLEAMKAKLRDRLKAQPLKDW